MLLLSRFSRVQLCATPEMAAHQATPSLGFSRQEHWSGLPFPSPMHEKWKVKSENEVAQLCLTLRDPMDCSLPGSSVHGISQARVLEWVPLPSPVGGTVVLNWTNLILKLILSPMIPTVHSILLRKEWLPLFCQVFFRVWGYSFFTWQCNSF